MKSFWIWSKKPKIIIDVILDNKRIAEFPISHVYDYLPSWYKRLKPTMNVMDNGQNIERPTFKRCDGMRYMLNNTFALPMWSDLSVTVDNNGNSSWTYPSASFNHGISQHTGEQLGNSFEPMVNVKINSPHRLYTKSNVKFFCSQATYSHNEYGGKLIVPPAVVEFRHNSTSHINTLMEKNYQYKFYAGQAMMYITPMTESLVEFKTQVVSIDEYQKLVNESMPHKFINSYKDRIRRNV